ncbi:MAG TPA: EamA family transporter [Terriglobia bacterium]|nr:EamA family transporter [Terriglobia bacterium]
MKTAVVLTVATLANSLGNLLLTMGMRGFTPPPEPASWLARTAGHVVSNPWMIGGVLLLIVFLASYMMALSWADLSFVLPATAPAYILTVFLARVCLGEEVTAGRWAGTVLIILGTCLVARSFGDSRGAAAGSPASAGELPKEAR